MSVWLSDVWRAWRSSLRRPGFLLLASGVLALGVAACSTAYTLVSRVMLTPLPYAAPERLIMIGRLDTGWVNSISPHQYQLMQPVQGVQSIGLMARGPVPVALTGNGEPVQVQADRMDHGVLPAFGVHMQLGRSFTEEEDRPAGPKAVILTHAFWQRSYGGDPLMLGRSVQIAGVPHIIVGILPANFDEARGDIVLPLARPSQDTDDQLGYSAIARLAEGVSVDSVSAPLQTHMQAFYAGKTGDADQYMRSQYFGGEDLRTARHAPIKETMLMFLLSGLFMLLIALVNLTNLMLLRALSRRHDSAVRLAMGATTWRMLLPLLAESLLVGLGGALAGLGLTALMLTCCNRFLPAQWLQGMRLQLDWTVMAGIIVLSLLGGLLTATLGAWRSRATRSMQELREGDRQSGRHSGRLGRVLVVTQMSLATCLLCGTGLFMHTLYDAARTPLGFSSDHLLTFELAPAQAQYADSAAVQALSQRVLERLRALPGVEQASAGTNLPMGSYFWLDGVHLPGGEAFFPPPQFRGVTADYFKTFGIPLLEGRGFNAGDIGHGESVAVVSRAFAVSAFGGHAVGKTVVIDDRHDSHDTENHPVIVRIVGVVGDTKVLSPLEVYKAHHLYMPLAQVPEHALQMFRQTHPLRFATHVRGNPDTYRNSVKAAVAEAAPDQPVAAMRRMDDIVSSSTTGERLNLTLIGVLSALALVLACAGVYAVMAVAVRARQREFGVRLALGLSPFGLLRLVMRDGLVQIGIGLLLGSALAFGWSRVLPVFLVQTGRSALDPASFLGTAIVLMAAGLLACLLPARQAARVQPMNALREG
ncbi:ADOP family duplicated permease [Dyella subtropica]|uniref:ADOP family duplicated permease n=1 Tax=Dyella subtropica TaxID=2992127 RepID=UPI00225671BE|nr:ADOP family duplicated permease [Dyella subtropica]